MVNSASQALSEFKSQRMGGLLSGRGSTVDAAPIMGTSLADSASDRLARSAPKKSTTAFMDQIRQSGQRYHQQAMQNAYARQQTPVGAAGGGGSRGYSLPGGPTAAPKGANGTQSYGGRYGLQMPASNAFSALENAYRQQFGVGFTVNSGWRSYADQVTAYQRMQAGGPKAATPGTSLHGYGTAVDLGGPIQNTGSAQHAWLRNNASQFGWYWVGQRYGEPWHWEYHPEWAK